MHQENRRSFVKKSLATSMTFTFSGLIRASGEEGGGTTYVTTSNLEESTFATTDSGGTTTYNPEDTTTWNPEETTAPPTTEETTEVTTLPYDPLVLVCIGAPSSFSQSLTSHNTISLHNGPVIVDPNQILGFNLTLVGPQAGDYSFTTFDLVAAGSASATAPLQKSVQQTVGVDQNGGIIFTPTLDRTTNPGSSTYCDSRELHIWMTIESGQVTEAWTKWYGDTRLMDVGNGPVFVDISDCDCKPELEGWEFAVMHLSEAIEFQNSLNE